LQVPECAKPLLIELRNQVLRSDGYPIIQYLPDDMAQDYYELASDEQITHFPDKYIKGKVDEIDVSIHVIANTNRYELKDINPKKLMQKQKSFKPYIEWRNEKENNGKFFWTLCMYPTQHMANDVNLTLEEYWAEVIKACYLDEEDPIKKWQEIESEIERVKTELNAMSIEKLHVKGEHIDLNVGIGENRQWLGGSGHNIPSFEVFISPDKYKTQGKIFFNQPLYSHGNKIQNITLEFKEGKIINSSAEIGEELLKEMIATDGADMIGEYSLTDSRLSKITGKHPKRCLKIKEVSLFTFQIHQKT
jgi:aminopeptidase